MIIVYLSKLPETIFFAQSTPFLHVFGWDFPSGGSQQLPSQKGLCELESRPQPPDPLTLWSWLLLNPPDAQTNQHGSTVVEIGQTKLVFWMTVVVNIKVIFPLRRINENILIVHLAVFIFLAVFISVEIVSYVSCLYCKKMYSNS